MQALDSLNQNMDKVITAAITIAIVVVLGKNMTNSPKLMFAGIIVILVAAALIMGRDSFTPVILSFILGLFGRG